MKTTRYVPPEDDVPPADPDDYAPGEPLSNGEDHARPVIFRPIIPSVDWKDKPVPPRKWIVPGFVPGEMPTLFTGDGGTGKSWLALQLAAARNFGGEWLGLLPEPGSTLVLSAEDNEDEMMRRLESIVKFHGKTFADLDQVQLIDLVGEELLLGRLRQGVIEETALYKRLDTYMGDFKPGLTTLDVLAALYGGDECSRTQTRQFSNLLHRLTRRHKSAILLLGHPSQTGMSSGSGMSGSTDWNNAFRSRCYFRIPKNAEGTEIKDLRIFEGKKNNRGDKGAPIEIQFDKEKGLFLPVRGLSGFDKMATEQRAEDVFLTLLKRFNAQGRNAGVRKGTSYAPALFAEEPDNHGIQQNTLCRCYDAPACR